MVVNSFMITWSERGNRRHNREGKQRLFDVTIPGEEVSLNFFNGKKSWIYVLIFDSL